MFTNRYFETEAWTDYLQLREERPELFLDRPQLPLCLSHEEICAYMNRTGQRIGVMYRSPYSILVVDLVRSPLGDLFAYERVLPAAASGAVVTIPMLSGRYVLLRQFRHSLRSEEISFPRGFGEPGLSAIENAKKELLEEIGAHADHLRLIGSVTPDSGLLSSRVSVVTCSVDQVVEKKDCEGIQEVLLMTGEELRSCIAAGKITDGYTLAAWALLRCYIRGLR